MNVFQHAREALAFRLGWSGWRRAPLSPVTLRVLLLLLGLGALAWFVLRDHGLLEHARLRRTLDSLERRSRRLETEIAWYQGRNQRLQANDSFTLEEEARRMGMARPGEEIIRVVLPEDTAANRKE